MPRAGQYRHRIEIQKNNPTVNSHRQKVDNWETFCIRKARRPRPPRTAPVVVAGVDQSEISTLTLFVRSDSRTQQIDSNFQLLYEGREYKIESAEDLDGLNTEIELTCKVREFRK